MKMKTLMKYLKVFSSTRIMLVLFAAAIPLLGLPAVVTADSGYGESDVQGSYQLYSDIQNNVANTSVTLDSNNFAKSYVQNSIYYDSISGKSYGILEAGAGVSAAYNNLYYVTQSRTTASYGDSWGCALGACATSIPTMGIPLNIGLQQQGTLSLNSGASVSAGYSFSSGFESYSFSFRLNEDGPPGTVRASADLYYYQGNTYTDTPIPVDIQRNGNIVSFSYDAPFVAYTGATFSDEVYINASVNGGFVDAIDPFTVRTTSLDPNFKFISDGGLSTDPISGPPTGVPEPSTMLLLGFGLIGLVGVRRKFKN